ncbi:hypothetical protein MRB53_015549 [Persea americana]|uniref:Uncharacterized protein n=1 Tax=Persea americana TaxID=3435 RepID=A0ACC2LZL1_PERAE|nr:hypothetical protein MRB53_015549 [Persea americana]
MNTIWIWIVFSDEIKARSFCLLCLRFLHQQRRLAQRCNSDPLRLSTAMGNNSNQRTVQSSNSSPIAVSLNAEIYSSASVQSAWPSSGDRLITVGSNFLLPSSARFYDNWCLKKQHRDEQVLDKDDAANLTPSERAPHTVVGVVVHDPDSWHVEIHQQPKFGRSNTC